MTPARAAELIQSAINQSKEGYTLEEVLTEIVEGRSVLLTSENALLVAKLYGRHGRITAHGWLGAGSLTELIDEIMPQAEAWARRQGASRMTVDGRRGWARALRDSGFEEESVTVGKDI
ncbi:MAG: hypothetical protein VX529_11015 [Pseudomonadota bacterium]|nr:hypothetical protein [Pseudomonadota bacterium]